TLMFMIEALLLGIIGSVLGIGLGILLVNVLQRVVENAFSQALAFAVYPQAMLFGLVTGVIVTLVFGFLPTLSAGKVRPNVVLSPTETRLPRAGILATLISVALMTGVMGILVGIIMENMLVGMLATFGTVVVLAIALLVFWLLVLIISRLPSFGSIRIKLAQRAMGTHAFRTASTLMALVIGMFSLSVILLMTNSLINVIEEVMAQQLGGNVLVVATSTEAEEAIDARVAELATVSDVQKDTYYSAQIVAINGERDIDALAEAAAATGRAELGLPAPGEVPPEEQPSGLLAGFANLDLALFQVNLFLNTATLKTASDVTVPYEMAEGVDVMDAEPGSMVLLSSDATEWLGLGVGDTMTFRFRNDEEVTVTIAGLMDDPSGQGGVTVSTSAPTSIVLADGSLPAGVSHEPPTYVMAVADEAVNDVVAELSNITGVFAVDVSQINELLDRLLSQFTALPLVIAVLALFASGIIIANTVSLATLERRREIGIMKAIGLQGSTVLGLLELENALVGLLGGVLGTGIGAVIILISGVISDSLSSFPLGMLLLLILLAVLIAVVATLVSALGAAREKPLIVLRYE
ncbi:MAG: FtsX-like permease family protein, partial [Anaerolineales bacterium]|nr:FtsX-like permease family protein [Anaerolineales bacterium]